MMTQYSIAKARDRFTQLIHDAEEGTPIEITRRGKRVAMVLSVQEYDRMHEGQPDFWDSLVKFRTELEQEQLDLDPDSIYQNIRDCSPGRSVDL